MNRSVIIIVFFRIRFISKPLFLCWEPITSRFSIVPPPFILCWKRQIPSSSPLNRVILPPPHKILPPASPLNK